MSFPLSISDDDICATCKHCVYDPGEDSFCKNDWPTEPDHDGQFRKCSSYLKITKEYENWSPEALKDLNS